MHGRAVEEEGKTLMFSSEISLAVFGLPVNETEKLSPPFIYHKQSLSKPGRELKVYVLDGTPLTSALVEEAMSLIGTCKQA